MKVLATMVALTFVLQSCSGPQRVNYEELNLRGQHQTLEVALGNGRQTRGTAFHIGPDSAYWMDPETMQLMIVPTSSIIKVTYVNHGLGFITGTLAGAAIGAGVGGSIALASSGCSSCIVDGRAVIAGGLTGLGLLAGMVIGTIEGYQTHYIIRE